MMQEQGAGAPQAAGQGMDVIKEAGATLLSQADSLKQFAGQLGQLGAPQGVAEKIGQAAMLIEQAMGEMGLGGQQQLAESGNPDTAGVASAQPADMRG